LVGGFVNRSGSSKRIQINTKTILKGKYLPKGMNCYNVLGISRNASPGEIKTAYREQAKRFHPDLNPGCDKAVRSFKDISKANEILSDPELRIRHDAQLIQEGTSPIHGMYTPQPSYGAPHQNYIDLPFVYSHEPQYDDHKWYERTP